MIIRELDHRFKPSDDVDDDDDDDNDNNEYEEQDADNEDFALKHINVSVQAKDDADENEEDWEDYDEEVAEADEEGEQEEGEGEEGEEEEDENESEDEDGLYLRVLNMIEGNLNNIEILSQGNMAANENSDASNEDSEEEQEQEEQPEDQYIGYGALLDVDFQSIKDLEVEGIKHMMAALDRIRRLMTDSNTLQKAIDKYASEPRLSDETVNEWLENAFFLLINSSNEWYINTRGDAAFQLTSYNLFLRTTLVQLVDPIKEAIMMPLLALYLNGYKNIYCNPFGDDLTLKIKMIDLVYQYSLASPSVFFKEFDLKTVEKYLDQTAIKQEIPQPFNIIDLLIRFYFDVPNGSTNANYTRVQLLLWRMLDLLFRLRLTNRITRLPVYLQKLKDNDTTPVHKDTVTQMMKYIQNSSGSADSKTKKAYDWLQLLAKSGHYTEQLFGGLEDLLKAQIKNENGILTDINEHLKGVLSLTGELNQDYFANTFIQFDFQVFKILNVLTPIIDDSKEIGNQIHELLQGDEIF